MTRPAGPDPRLVASSAHVFVADLGSPFLEPGDEHHLVRVLRLRAGEPVTITDGAGNWRCCRLAAGGGLEPDGPIETVPEPPYELAVAFAPPKGDRSELIVQKLTELGVDRIVPMLTRRSVNRTSGERATKQVERWRRIAREAAMQSRRVRLAEVESITEFAAVATRPGATLAAPGGAALDGSHRLVLVGPEGGWAEDELQRPLSRVGLGNTVLRAETAAIVACALAVSVRADAVADRP